MKIYDNLKLLQTNKLEEIQYYIYVIENDRGDIKVGISHDVGQRVKSLSNSNAGGSKITRVAVSQPTYLRTLEGVVHEHFWKYRVKCSEWFVGIDFNTVVEYVESLFNDKSYNTLNECRKQAGGYFGRRSKNGY